MVVQQIYYREQLINFLLEILNIPNKLDARINAIACIICKALSPNFVSPFSFRTTMLFNNAPVLKQYSFLQKIGLTMSYSYLQKLKIKFCKDTEDLPLECIDFAKKGVAFITFDNVQKARKPGLAGLNCNAKCPISTSSVINLVEVNNQIQEENSSFSVKNYATLDFLKIKKNIMKLEIDEEDSFYIYQQLLWINSHSTQEKKTDKVTCTSRATYFAENYKALPAKDINPSSEIAIKSLLDQYIETRYLYKRQEEKIIFCDRKIKTLDNCTKSILRQILTAYYQTNNGNSTKNFLKNKVRLVKDVILNYINTDVYPEIYDKSPKTPCASCGKRKGSEDHMICRVKAVEAWKNNNYECKKYFYFFEH